MIIPHIPLANVGRVITIILVALILRLLVNFFSKKLIERISNIDGRRIRTISSLVSTTLSVLITIVAVLMILKEFGFDITPLLASASLVGLTISFGAQTLVKDIISGVLLLTDNPFDVGDKVDISGKQGIVEKINLRNIVLKDEKDHIHFIPNGSISMITNLSKDK